MAAANTSAPVMAVALISAAAMAYEILLIRVFAIVHWHHLVAIAISLALLGYGASGTFLATIDRYLSRLPPTPVFVACAWLFSVSALLCIELAQRIPFDPQALAWDLAQIGYLATVFLVLALPFFVAATFVGFALWRYRDSIPRTYGADLLGASVGAAAVLLATALIGPAPLLTAIALCGLLAAVISAASLRWHPVAVLLISLILGLAGILNLEISIQPAAYKDLSQAQQVAGAQTSVRRHAVAGTIEVVHNPLIPGRAAPGMSLYSPALPPHQDSVYLNGDRIGEIGDFRDPTSTTYLAYLTSALPYALLERPRVALLNAGLGGDVQQALLLGAVAIDAVEANPQLHRLLCDDYRAWSRTSCDSVDWHLQSARSFIAATELRFDLITITLHADPVGLDALQTDYDSTQEAFASYLGHLEPGGILAVHGPTQFPPRQSLRAVSNARDALQHRGIARPGDHIAVIRGWQRFATLVSATPLSDAAQQRIRDVAASLGFDVVWLPSIRADEVNRYQQLSQPYYFLAIQQLLHEDSQYSTSRGSLPLAIRPSTDDRPFPHRSMELTTWANAVFSGERALLAQSDLGVSVGLVTLILVALGSLVLIVAPLLIQRRLPTAAAGHAMRIRVLVYFAFVGIAFMFIEIAWILHVERFLGHPVYAATAILASFLLFAGLGSLWTQQQSNRGLAPLLLAVMLIGLFAALFHWLLPVVFDVAAGMPLAGRILTILVVVAPLAFAMGIPFSFGLRGVADSAPSLVPWAWAINGCASVISAVLTPLLGSAIGLNMLILIATLAYLSLPLVAIRTPNKG